MVENKKVIEVNYGEEVIDRMKEKIGKMRMLVLGVGGLVRVI